jgi:hypothetical protein
MCNNSRCEQCSITNGFCLICKQGFWGQNCQSTCKSETCIQCYKDTGDCSKCSPGRWGHLCQSMCMDGCKCCNISNGACTFSCPDISGTSFIIFDNRQIS